MIAKSRIGALVLLALAAASCSPPSGPASQTAPQSKPFDLGPQELEMVFARLRPGTNTLRIVRGWDYISPGELDLLRGAGVSGTIETDGVDRRGQGIKKARVLVVMFENVLKSVALPQPDATNAIYVQMGGGFILLPTNTPVIKKTVRLVPYQVPDGPATFWQIDMGTVIQGGGAILWGKNAGRSAELGEPNK